VNPKPHILLITCDELRKDALSAYGCEAIKTTNIDAIASTGTRFHRAYAPSSLCLPSRCALLTGLLPHNSGAYSNFRPCALSPEIPNLYNQLKRAGYTTGHIGKCHYSPAPYDRTRKDATLDNEQVKDFYMSLGLDHLDLLNGKMNSIWFWNDYSRELQAAGFLDVYREAANNPAYARVFTFPGPAEWHPDAWTGRKAVEWISKQRADTPTFTWVSISGPHYPFDPPKEYLDRVDPEKIGTGIFKEGDLEDPTKTQSRAYCGGKGTVAEGRNHAPERACKNFSAEYWKKLRHYYYANVALIDEWVGRVVAAARERFGENLMVIFTADHGEMLGNHRLWGKNRCAYEDVLNIPFIVQFPGQGEKRDSNAMVSLIDLNPTCLALAGLEPIRSDGRDLRRSIEDGGHPVVISESDQFLSIFDGRYKYLHVQDEGSKFDELYDVKNDPNEFTNLAGSKEHSAELARLRGILLERFVADCLE
jgi:arylsulfatase A-like enzyme